jgi:hypothetical protein
LAVGGIPAAWADLRTLFSDEDLSPVRVRDDSLKDVMLKISMILNKNLLQINSIIINFLFKHKFKDDYKRARISLRKKKKVDSTTKNIRTLT